MKAATRLTTKGQVVIPKAVRDRLKLKPGTRLQVHVTEDGSIVLRPDTGASGIDAIIDEVFGCLAGYEGDPIAELEADHRAEIEADERWLRRRRG